MKNALNRSLFNKIALELLENPNWAGLDLEEAAGLLACLEDEPPALLDALALARLAGRAARPFSCGIINAKSGRCSENCLFCAQSAHYETGAPVYPLVGAETLIERARLLAEHKVGYFGIVTSGVGPSDEDFAAICRAAERIRSESGIKLCASLGVIDREQAEKLKAAGFTSYHHNLETARSFYPAVCGTHDFEQRMQTVRNARAAGLRCCTGGIFGLGENWEQRLEFSATLRELDVHSIPVNFLTPIKGTPLENSPGLPPREALTIIAVLRLMHPGRDLLVCGGRAFSLGRFESLIFAAGANGVMVGDYLVSKNNPLEQDLNMLETLGLRHA